MKLSYIIASLLLFSSCSIIDRFKGVDSGNPSQVSGNDSYGNKVRKRLIENIPNLRFCLEKFLPATESGSFDGAVTFKFSINRFGMVRDVMITSDHLRNIKAKGCMVKTITVIEMPNHTSKKDFKISQPIGISMTR